METLTGITSSRGCSSAGKSKLCSAAATSSPGATPGASGLGLPGHSREHRLRNKHGKASVLADPPFRANRSLEGEGNCRRMCSLAQAQCPVTAEPLHRWNPSLVTLPVPVAWEENAHRQESFQAYQAGSAWDQDKGTCTSRHPLSWNRRGC